MRTRPGRSVRNIRPSGAKAIAHGISRFWATTSTEKRVPSSAVITSPGGVGDRIGRRRIVAGGPGGSDDEREREGLRPGCAHDNLLAASGADGVGFSLLRIGRRSKLNGRAPAPVTRAFIG